MIPIEIVSRPGMTFSSIEIAIAPLGFIADVQYTNDFIKNYKFKI